MPHKYIILNNAAADNGQSPFGDELITTPLLTMELGCVCNFVLGTKCTNFGHHRDYLVLSNAKSDFQNYHTII